MSDQLCSSLWLISTKFLVYLFIYCSYSLEPEGYGRYGKERSINKSINKSSKTDVRKQARKPDKGNPLPAPCSVVQKESRKSRRYPLSGVPLVLHSVLVVTGLAFFFFFVQSYSLILSAVPPRKVGLDGSTLAPPPTDMDLAVRLGSPPQSFIYLFIYYPYSLEPVGSGR